MGKTFIIYFNSLIEIHVKLRSIIRRRNDELEAALEDPDTLPALASFGRKRKFDSDCIDAAKLLVVKYSHGYHDGTKFING